MQRSDSRILVTHVGSLPRPPELLDLLLRQERGEAVDADRLDELQHGAVVASVALQRELGIDVVNDGEQGRTNFISYVNERLGGFESAGMPADSPWRHNRDAAAFPDYYAWANRTAPNAAITTPHVAAVGPITYVGHDALARDIAHLKAALADSGATEAFMPSISPTNIEEWNANHHYATGEEYLFAIADAMHDEYEAIIDAGLLLQVDDPALVTRLTLEPDWTVDDARHWIRLRVDALNHALRGLPADRIRFHTCYSINQGPRIFDMELADVVDLMLEINAGAYLFEAANPRHEHEWELWREVTLPEDKVLAPGLVTNSSVMIEHPETVAQRLVRFAEVVGRERVIASADCGFASFAATEEFPPEIVWAKLRALSEGAARATARLWGG